MNSCHHIQEIVSQFSWKLPGILISLSYFKNKIAASYLQFFLILGRPCLRSGSNSPYLSSVSSLSSNYAILYQSILTFWTLSSFSNLIFTDLIEYEVKITWLIDEENSKHLWLLFPIMFLDSFKQNLLAKFYCCFLPCFRNAADSFLSFCLSC